MSLIINLRGTNGSGKSTAARSMLRHDSLLPEIREKGSNVTIMGVNCLTDGRTILVGPYPEGKTGGCDRVKTFEIMRGAIRRACDMRYPIVIFESVTVSTVFGSWADFCQQEPFWWVYLNTPLDVCIERVKLRNGGKEFDEEMVADKYRAIKATQRKAIDAGFQVYDLHWADSINGLNTLALLGT